MIAKIMKQQEMMDKYMEEQEKKDNKFASSSTAAAVAPDNIEESQSLSQSKGKDKPTESYDTDTFEE